MDLIEKSCMRKIYIRLLPFAILSYFLAYIDRINVSFAALTMRGDLGISAGEYGFALGTFYWGYFIFEVPSNVVLEKVGARLWIARIMITWGILAGLTAIVTGATSFGVVRFFLGVAEAGFFPGIVLYFTYWFPTYHHARIVSGFLIGLPIAVAGGAPISTALLGLDGLWGLRGWQIMYIAEGVPTVLVGLLTLLVLTDKPAQAKFLTEAEKAWLTAKLAADRPLRFSRFQGAVLADAAVVHARHRRGGIDRLDQLDRQPRRVLRSLVCRRHQGLDRQLCRRPLRAGVPVRPLGGGLRAVPGYPEPRRQGAEGAAGRGSRGLEVHQAGGPSVPP